MAAKFEAYTARNSKRVTEAEAALEAETSTLAAVKEKAYKSDQALKSVMALISIKDWELDADRVALAVTKVKAFADVTTTQVQAKKAAEAEVAAVRAEAE